MALQSRCVILGPQIPQFDVGVIAAAGQLPIQKRKGSKACNRCGVPLEGSRYYIKDSLPFAEYMSQMLTIPRLLPDTS